MIQKTSTGSRCLVYNITRTPEAQGEAHGQFRIEQISEHLLLGLTSVDHKYRYTGLLHVNPGATTNANMTVHFPLSTCCKYFLFYTDHIACDNTNHLFVGFKSPLSVFFFSCRSCLC